MMRVFIYPERTYEALGAERFEVEWQTVKAKALKRIEAAQARGELDEVSPDRDIDYHYRQYPTKKAALRAARGIVNLGNTAYGCATVVRQVVDWLNEDDRIAEWADTDEREC